MSPEEIKQLVATSVADAIARYYHTHDGITSPLVDGENVQHRVISAAPTDNAPNGTIRLYLSGSTYRLYMRANNTWKYKTFDNT